MLPQTMLGKTKKRHKNPFSGDIFQDLHIQKNHAAGFHWDGKIRFLRRICS